jgi:hypothetical protein
MARGRRSTAQRKAIFSSGSRPARWRRQLRERASKIRVLFEHGTDTVLGKQPIADIEEMRGRPDGVYFRAKLLRGLPELLVEGLRRGLVASGRLASAALAGHSAAVTTANAGRMEA